MPKPAIIYVRVEGRDGGEPARSGALRRRRRGDARRRHGRGRGLDLNDALLAVDASNARTGGFLVTAPAGTDVVEVVATAYTHDGSSACTPGQPQLLAIADVQIVPHHDLRGRGQGGAGGTAGSDGGTTTSSGGSGGGTSTSSSGSGSGGSTGSGGAGSGGASAGSGGTGGATKDGG